MFLLGVRGALPALVLVSFPVVLASCGEESGKPSKRSLSDAASPSDADPLGSAAGSMSMTTGGTTSGDIDAGPIAAPHDASLGGSQQVDAAPEPTEATVPAAFIPRTWEFVGGPMFVDKLAGTAADDLWATNSSDLYHYDGQTWQFYSPDTAGRVTGVWASSPTDAYASIFANVVVHWNGTTWQKQPLPVATISNSVWGSGANDIYLAGLMHSTGDGSWSPIDPPGQVDYGGFTAIWGTGPDDYWFGGGYNLVRKANGGPLGLVEYPPDAAVSDVKDTWGSSVDDLYVLFGGEAIRLRNGTSWTTQQIPLAQGEHLGGITGTGPNDVYIAADRGLYRSLGDDVWVPETIDPNAANVSASTVFSPTPAVIFVATDSGIYRGQ